VISYAQDDLGNRNVGGSSSSPNGSHNLVYDDGTYTYLYDAEGNATRKTLKSTGAYDEYTWDHRNQLIRVVSRTSAGVMTKDVRFEYDYFGRKTLERIDNDANGTLDRYTAWTHDGAHAVLDFSYAILTPFSLWEKGRG
jgi:hypothetical protein